MISGCDSLRHVRISRCDSWPCVLIATNALDLALRLPVLRERDVGLDPAILGSGLSAPSSGAPCHGGETARRPTGDGSATHHRRRPSRASL